MKVRVMLSGFLSSRQPNHLALANEAARLPTRQERTATPWRIAETIVKWRIIDGWLASHGSGRTLGRPHELLTRRTRTYTNEAFWVKEIAAQRSAAYCACCKSTYLCS
jgi:hypothetical protein